MLFKINNSTKLSTGQSVTGPIVLITNDTPRLNVGQVIGDLKVWTSQSNYDGNKDHTYLEHSVTGGRTTNLSHEIPQADLDQVESDKNFGIIGTNYPSYFISALAIIIGCDAADIDLTEII